MNGYEATRIIKEIAFEYNESVAIIGYTAYCNDKEIEKCKKFGMDHCL